MTQIVDLFKESFDAALHHYAAKSDSSIESVVPQLVGGYLGTDEAQPAKNSIHLTHLLSVAGLEGLQRIHYTRKWEFLYLNRLSTATRSTDNG